MLLEDPHGRVLDVRVCAQGSLDLTEFEAPPTNLDLIENRRSELQAAFLAFGSVSEQLSGHFESLPSGRGQCDSLSAAGAGRDQFAHCIKTGDWA